MAAWTPRAFGTGVTDSEVRPSPGVCIDRYGWIERFMGGPTAPAYNRVIDAVGAPNIVTPVVVLYEDYKRVKGSLGEEIELRDIAALERTRVVLVDRDIAREATDHSLARRIPFSDALTFATARRFGTELYTSDPALKGLPGVTMIRPSPGRRRPSPPVGKEPAFSARAC